MFNSNKPNEIFNQLLIEDFEHFSIENCNLYNLFLQWDLYYLGISLNNHVIVILENCIKDYNIFIGKQI